MRLVVRRTRLTDTAQQRLWPTGATTPASPTSTCATVEADHFHRCHAAVELAIRDLKEGALLDHVPSGNFYADSAWLERPRSPTT